MREGSGWTYQQIADHEGVEIGTIETLLWRARQALKREFAVVSDSKEALAGFLVATGALIRRTVFRAAHRGASVQHSGGGTGAMRNAVAGVAVTGAAVAAAFIAPHALVELLRAVPYRRPVLLWQHHLSSWGRLARARGRAQARLAMRRRGPVRPSDRAPDRAPTRRRTDPGAPLARTGPSPAAEARPTRPAASRPPLGALSAGSSPTGGLTNGLSQSAGGLQGVVQGVTNGLGQAASGVTSGVTSGVGQAVTGVTSGVGGGLSSTAAGVTSGVNGLTQSIGLGSVLPGTSGAGSSSGSGASSATPSTTTTTNPVQGVLGGAGRTVGGLLGGG